MHRINWIFPIANDFNLFLLFLKGPTQNRAGSWCFLPFSSALYVMLITQTHLEFTFCLRMAHGVAAFPWMFLCSAVSRAHTEGKVSSAPCSAAFLHASHHPLAFGSFTWKPFLEFVSSSMERASLSESAAPPRLSQDLSVLWWRLNPESHALTDFIYLFFLFTSPVFSSWGPAPCMTGIASITSTSCQVDWMSLTDLNSPGTRTFLLPRHVISSSFFQGGYKIFSVLTTQVTDLIIFSHNSEGAEGRNPVQDPCRMAPAQPVTQSLAQEILLIHFPHLSSWLHNYRAWSRMDLCE